MELTNVVLKGAENKHYQFQLGCYFSDSKINKNSLFLWNNKITDNYWNYATKINFDGVLYKEMIDNIIDFFKSIDRVPTIYVTPFSKLNGNLEKLKQSGFNSVYKEVWMFYGSDKPKVITGSGFVFKKVKTIEDMKIFVETFNVCYGGSTPDEPYGELPKEYSISLFESFSKQQKYININHYIGLLEGVPAGIVTLIYSGDYGCIYNVGTIPVMRKKGIAKSLSLNAVLESFKNNSKVVFLQTEQGSYNEKYYANIGFSTKFIGEGFSLE